MKDNSVNITIPDDVLAPLDWDKYEDRIQKS